VEGREREIWKKEVEERMRINSNPGQFFSSGGVRLAIYNKTGREEVRDRKLGKADVPKRAHMHTRKLERERGDG